MGVRRWAWIAVTAAALALAGTAAGAPPPELQLGHGPQAYDRAPAPLKGSTIPKRVTAAANLHACGQEAPGGKCGRVKVPLDRAHPNRGKIGIFFEYYKHTSPGPSDEAIFASGGGPGFSATQDDFGLPPHLRNNVFTPLLDTRDLVIFDQRGVGKSGAINCPQLQHGPANPYKATKACGKQLGNTATLYTSRDIALDMDAIREALEIEQIDLWGGSYAAVDVQAYASRFPEHVRSAVLDGPISTVEWDPFAGSVEEAMERANTLVCERSVNCSNDIGSVVSELAWLASELRANPLEGTALDAENRPHDVELTEAILLWRIMQTYDGNYTPESELAAASNSLEAGDEAPLLRLAAENDFQVYGDEGPPRLYSAGHFQARYCTELPMAWDKDEPSSVRRQQFEDAVEAVPNDEYDPFAVDAWLAPHPIGVYAPDSCISWPVPDAPMEPPIPDGVELPGDVPALIISGDLDYNTPSSDALALQAAWDNSEYVEIANAGHFPSVTPRFECSAQILQDFIENLATGDTSCADDLDPVHFPATGRFPVTAADAVEADQDGDDESTTLDRKVATVVAATATDSIRRTFIQQRTVRGPALRGGTFNPSFQPGRFVGELRNARFAEDVKVNGMVKYPFEEEAIDATLEVDGPGDSDGTLDVTGVWFGFGQTATDLKIQGDLGGRSISLEVPAT